jgi:ParB family chromosome partitioning protein
MAMLALVENMQRENLTDYEIGMSIHRAVKEFKFKKDLAEALGIGRTDFYRYLTFSELPEWVCSRLNESPSLISKRTAEGLKIFLQDKNAEHCRMIILAALDKLEHGSLQQGEFVQYIAKAVQPKPDMTEKISSVFELEGRKIGIMQFVPNKSLTLKLDGSVITGDKFKELEAFVKRLIG